MELTGWGRLWGAVIGCILVVGFSAFDYLLRPRLPDYFGDNDVYVLVILLAVEFVVIWRAVLAADSAHGRRGTRK